MSDLIKHAFPGGYSIRYLMEDGATLCADCTNGDATWDNNDPQWRIHAQYIYWEGPTKNCAHCNGEMPSEYGDPDEE